MEIIKSHYAISKPVRNYAEIRKEAEALKKFIDNPRLKGYYNKAYAICHCQVSETPYAFFVVADDVIVEGLLKHKVIINPEIIETPATMRVKLKDKKGKVVSDKEVPNKMIFREACLSFPFRKEKSVERYFEVKVRYQVPILFGLKLKTIEEYKQKVIAHIFQHEIDHINGRNIFLESQEPFKWWELIGTPKPQGGTSIGD